MNNKADVGQVFIFILAGLVLVLLLTYGIPAIIDIMEKQKEVSFTAFIKEFKDDVKVIKTNFGTVRTVTLASPSGVSDICIMDSRCPESTETNYKLYYNYCKNNGQNVFFKPAQQMSIIIPDLEVENGIFCKKITGDIVLLLEGKGNKVKVSDAKESS